MKKISLAIVTSLAGVSICGTMAVAANAGMEASLFNAENVVFTVEFSRTNGTLERVAGGYTTSAVTAQGTAMYLYTNTESDLTKEAMSSYLCEFDSGDIYFTVSADSNGTSLQQFQNIESISITTNSSSSISFLLEKSSNGVNWETAGTSIFTRSGEESDLVKGAKYVRVKCNNSSYRPLIKNVKIKYSCSLEPGPTPSSSEVSSSSESVVIAGRYIGYDKYSTQVVMTLDENGNGTYEYDRSKLNLSYILSAPLLKLNLVSYVGNADETDFGTVRLFKGTQPNDTGVLNDETITVTVYQAWGATYRESTLVLTKE